jgi:hypothetical protein
MGSSAPTGDDGNSAGHGLFTPTLAAGKGFGDFSVQSTLGITFPSGNKDRLGWPMVWNTAFQYQVLGCFWAEVKTNYTWFAKGEHTGKSQLFPTPAPCWDGFRSTEAWARPLALATRSRSRNIAHTTTP